jgi:P4 family phage/plasmid primase-like protien
MYEIIPIKGESFIVNGQHDLVVKASNMLFYNNKIIKWVEYDDKTVLKMKYKICDSNSEFEEFYKKLLEDIKLVKKDDIIILTVHEYLKLPKHITKFLNCYRPDIVNFKKQDVKFDPWMLGYCLGSSNNTLYCDLDDYKFNNKETRLELLAGIMDSSSNKNIISLNSERLMNDVIWLARSLGISCYKSKVGDYFQTTLTRDPLKLSFKVKKIEDGNFYGFELDNNRRFILGGGDFTIVKNSNGKSVCVDLFEQSFGDYCCKLPITLLTQKRAASNAATSELARTKGKRFACLQEPSEDEKLNVGLMKELTGGDKIMARQLYKDPIEFKPQFKMVLTCNQLPNVPANDNGTWRRLRVIEFTSKFCETPDPANPNEFHMDTDLSTKFLIWREYFLSLLIKYYKIYIENGITEPDEVLVCTREYQRNNDVYLDFVEQEFERDDMGFTSYNQVHTSFKSWLKDNNLSHISIKRKDIMINFGKIFGKQVVFSNVEGYKGWRFKNSILNMRDELDSK